MNIGKCDILHWHDITLLGYIRLDTVFRDEHGAVEELKVLLHSLSFVTDLQPCFSVSRFIHGMAYN